MRNINKKKAIVIITTLVLLMGLIILVFVCAKYIKSLNGTTKDVTIESAYKTILFNDGTFIINEKLSDHTGNVNAHDGVYKMFEPLNSENPYIFDEGEEASDEQKRPWKSDVAQIKSVQIGSNIAPVSMAYWFNELTACTSIDLTGIDSSNVTDIKYAFNLCISLPSINLDNIDTSNVVCMKNMFSNCTKITELDLSSFNTVNVTEMAEMFRSCSNLKTIYAKDSFTTSNVTLDDDMFTDCNALVGRAGTKYTEAKVKNSTYARIDKTEQPGYFTGPTSSAGLYYGVVREGIYTILYLSATLVPGKAEIENKAALTSGSESDCGWDAQRANITDVVIQGESNTKIKPTSLAYWFYNMSKLTGIVNLTGIDTSNVTNMSGAFELCGVSVLRLSEFNTAKVETMAEMFRGCDNLHTLDLSGFDTSNVTNMSYMFSRCHKLAEFNVSKFETSNVKYMTGMFAECESLSMLDLSKFNTLKVENMAKMFFKCNNLTTIYATDSFVTTSVTNGSNMFTDCNVLVGGNGTKYATAGVEDSTYAWIDGKTDLATGSTRPGYFTQGPTPSLYYGIQTEDTNRVLYLSATPVPGKAEIENKAALTSGSRSDCGWDAQRANITDVVIQGESNTKIKPTSLAYWFYNMSKLTGIVNLTGIDTSNVTDMSSAFALCGVSELRLSEFNTAKVETMAEMFRGCDNLHTLDLSGFDTSNVTNMSYMFDKCSSLTEINLSSFDTSKVTNMSAMFLDCRLLTELDLSKFNTKKVENMDQMFEECALLKTIYTTESFDVTKVFYLCILFKGCSKLVGGLGTQCNGATNIDSAYARIDKIGQPGYFTDGSPDLYYGVVTEGRYFVLYLSATLVPGKAETENKEALTSASQDDCKWDGLREIISKVEILGESNKKIKPTSLAYWFSNMKELSSIVNLAGIDTSNVTNMSCLFSGCNKLTKLDVSSFNTANVTNMAGMFDNCTNLVTITASDDFGTTKLSSEQNMFINCPALKGPYHTWSETDISSTYARIDTTSTKGYFTDSKPHLYYGIKDATLYLAPVVTTEATTQNDGAVALE